MTKQNGRGPSFTPASAWKRSTELIELPSGRRAMLRRPQALEMIMTDGSIPNTLASAFAESMQSGKPVEWKLDKDDLPALANLMNTLCLAAFVEPKVLPKGHEPDYETSISIEDLDTQDKLFVLTWSIAGLQEKKFNP